MFLTFGASHRAALALTLVLPLAAAALARRRPEWDRALRLAFAALLVGGWIGFYLTFAWRGWLTQANALPLNLCDWASFAMIAALLAKSPRAYELGYFWGLGGTLQGLLTPDIARDFPDPQFVFFFLGHGGIIAALLYLALGTGLRPVAASLPRVAAATLFYVAVAGGADWLLGVNYGFLRAKPATASLLSLLSPWPGYIPELVLIGLASLLLYYVPFLGLDLARRYRRRGRMPSARAAAASSPSS